MIIDMNLYDFKCMHIYHIMSVVCTLNFSHGKHRWMMRKSAEGSSMHIRHGKTKPNTLSYGR